MDTKGKLTLRKPLEPIDDDVSCKAEFASLMVEYEALEKLKVKEEALFHVDGETLVSLEDYNKQVAAYSTRRDEYVNRHTQHVETIDMVRAKIKSLKVRLKKAHEESSALRKRFEEKWGDEIPLPVPEDEDLVINDPIEWQRQSEACHRRWEEWCSDDASRREVDGNAWALFVEIFAEQCKFEEIQKEADAAFEYAAKHTLADGTVLSDEELRLREQGRSDE